MSSPQLRPLSGEVSGVTEYRSPLPAVRHWVIAAAIAAAVFLVQLHLTVRLNSHDNLRMLNRFFDADNAWYLVNFESGNQAYGSYGGRNLVHPNVANFIHPLVVVSEKIAALFSHGSKDDLVTSASLAVAPAFAALKSGLLFLTLIVAGFTLLDALLAAALASVAFSSVIFGCLPESFVISGACFAAFFLLAAWTIRTRKFHRGSWIVVGLLLSSTTSSNLGAFFAGLLILLTFFLRDPEALKKTISTSTAALGATAICFLVLTAVHGSFKGVGRRIGQLEEVRFSLKSIYFDFPRTLARTLVPVYPNQIIGTDEEKKSKQVQVVRFTFRDDLANIQTAVPTITGYQRFSGGIAWQAVASTLIFAAVLLSSRVRQSPARAIYSISLAQLLFHWSLHAFFGLELFLYSQHWIVPLVIAISSGLTLPNMYRWVSRTLVVTLTIVAAVHTTSVMNILLRP